MATLCTRQTDGGKYSLSVCLSVCLSLWDRGIVNGGKVITKAVRFICTEFTEISFQLMSNLIAPFAANPRSQA